MTAVTSSSTAIIVHNKHENWREWVLASDATAHFTLDATCFYDYVIASPGTTAKVANDTQEEVTGYGKLDLLVKQPGGIVKMTTLHRVALLL